MVEEIQSNINSFADDTCLSMVVGNPNAAGTILQNDIKNNSDVNVNLTTGIPLSFLKGLFKV